jgi:hypothetical protein
MASDLIKNLKRLLKPTVMKSDEIRMNKKSWRRYSDAELADTGQKFSIGMPYDTMAPYSTWTVRGLSNDEILNWLRQVKQNAPDFMYKGLLAITEKEVNGNRWELIKASLSREFRYI